MNKDTKDNYQQSLKIPKPVLITAKTLEFLSPKQATKFAYRLFQTPIKYPTPKRELHMDEQSKRSSLFVPEINKTIQTYHYGESPKKVLLVHGWSGRGTQLVKIADQLLANGYSTVSFDGRAHGRSSGKTTTLPEFIHSLLQIEHNFGPFEAAIGHSLGSMALLNSVKKGLSVKKMALVGSGDNIEDIIYDFTDKLGLQRSIGKNLKNTFDHILQEDVNSFSASVAATEVVIPVLLIHDKNDVDSPLDSSIKIDQNLKESKLIITEGLGHRKILGNQEVIKQIVEFIQKES